MDVDAIPTMYRGVYRQAMTGRSRRAAIRANCLMCVAWNSAEVRRCTAPACPLFPYRLGGVSVTDDATDDTAARDEPDPPIDKAGADARHEPIACPIG